MIWIHNLQNFAAFCQKILQMSMYKKQLSFIERKSVAIFKKRVDNKKINFYCDEYY